MMSRRRRSRIDCNGDCDGDDDDDDGHDDDDDDEDYYYYEDWTDFGTYGGQYGKNVEAPAGQWFVVVFNQIG